MRQEIGQPCYPLMLGLGVVSPASPFRLMVYSKPFETGIVLTSLAMMLRSAIGHPA